MSHQSELDRIQSAILRQNQDWERARAALSELGSELQFRMSGALREELEAALTPKPIPSSNPLDLAAIRA